MPGSANATFSRIVRLKRMLSCRAAPIWRRSHATSATVRSTPSMPPAGGAIARQPDLDRLANFPCTAAGTLSPLIPRVDPFARGI